VAYDIYIFDNCCCFLWPLSEVAVSTPALVAQNEVVNDDEDDEPPLNENDDDDLDDLDQGDDQNTSHLVLAQFDKVTTSFHSQFITS
jgi:hypothetical protein